MRYSPPVSSWIWPSLLLLIAIAFAVAGDKRMTPVIVPLAAGLFIFLGFFWILWRRGRGGIPWFEVGAVYALVVALYMAFPLIGFLVLGGRYTPFNDGRLINLAPDPPEVGSVGWLYVAHLFGFASVYLAVRGRLPMTAPRPRQPTVVTMFAIITVYLLVLGFEIALGLFYNLTASTYSESYLVWQRLPLVLAQLRNHLQGMQYPLSLAILAALFVSYRTSRSLIFVWLVVVTSVGLTRMGSRTEIVLLLLSATAMYHVLVRPLSVTVVTGAAAAGLLGFVAFGALRSGHAVPNPFAAATEFEVLLGNAVHLTRVGHTIDHVPAALYFADLAALVPQQLVPFTKIDVAAWYVTRFFPEYAAAGGGLAFGTIAEAALTGGMLSAVVRGAALGLCFATLHRWYLRRSRSFWAFVFYIWLMSLCYQCFRNTTFSLGVLIGYRFLPAVVIVTSLTAFFTAVIRGRSLSASNAIAPASN
jgi:hypothetical protein